MCIQSNLELNNSVGLTKICLNAMLVLGGQKCLHVKYHPYTSLWEFRCAS